MASRFFRLSALGFLTHAALAVALVAACAATAHAQAIWTGAADPSPPNGVFNNPGNWSGTFGLVPGAGSLGIFNNNTTYTITFTGNQALAHASVRSGQLSWLSDSATVRTFTLGLLSAGGSNQTLTIGSATRPMLVTSSNPIEVGSVITVGGGAIVVDGASSTLNGPSALLGSFSTSDGTLRYQNGAQGTISGAIDLGNTANNGSDGLLEILSGADLTSGNLNLATTASTAIGTLNVTGAGSTMVQSGASTLTVGSATGGAGTINVNTDGAFTSGSGLITVNATGTINRTGTGVFNVTGNLLLNGGDFISPSGSFSRGVGQSLTVQSGGLFNATPADAPTATVGSAAGTFSTSGAVAITSGELRLNGGRGGSHNGVLQPEGAGGGAGGLLQVSGGTLSLAGTGSGGFRGGAGGGDSIFASGAAGLGGAGGQATLSAGTVTLGDASQLNFTGGNGGPSEASSSGSGGTGGLGGQVTAAGATITLSQSAQFVLDGGVGGSRIANNAAGGLGGAGGIFTLNSGTLSLSDSAAVAMRGGAGGSAAGGFTSPGGNGGVGGTLTQSGGTLNLNSGKIIVAGGAGGAGSISGSPGLAGAAGLVNVTGGTFNFTAGQITADTAITPATPAALVKVTMNVSGGAVNLNNDFTNHLGTLNLTNTGVINASGANGANGGGGIDQPGGVGAPGRSITTSGTLALSGAGSQVDLLGGAGGGGGIGSSASGGTGGAGGTLSVTAGTTTLSDSSVVNLRGGSGGGSIAFSASGRGGIGGTFNVAGGTTTISGAAAVDLRGGSGGGGGPVFSGDGGTGGIALLSAGVLNLSGGKVLLAGGAGGASDIPGDAGAAGSFKMSGGTLAFSAGQITGNTSIVPTTPIALVGATMNVSAGTLNTTAGEFGITNSATLNLSGGVMNASTVTLNGSTFNFAGGTLHATTFNGNLTQAGGTLAPGASPGTLAVNGNYTQNAGVLEIELGGTNAAQWDKLNVSGNVQLAGVIDVNLFGDYTPTVGKLWEIIDVAGTLSGTFAGLAEGAPFANYSGTLLTITYAGGDGNDVFINTAAGLAGDFDFDGDVDGSDFLKWQRGESANPLSAGDLADWRANFGAPALTVSVAVPEQGALLLTLLGGSLGMLIARSQRVAKGT